MADERLVGVRYVGVAPTKQDTLLYRRGRVWRRGEVLMVPPKDARAYLKHPGVWRAESEPFDGRVPERLRSDTEIGALLRAGRFEDLKDELAAFAAQCEANPPQQALALDPDEATRLEEFVPGLAYVLTKGREAAVLENIERNEALLRAYTPLLEACVREERGGHKRDGVLGALEALRAGFVGEGDEAAP